MTSLIQRLFAACCALTVAATSANAAPRVVASIKPLHALVAGVMGDIGQPHLLLRGAQSPHSFALRPSDARALHDADALFWIGPSLEAPLTRIVSKLSRARRVAMLETPGLLELPVDGHAGHSDHSDHSHDVTGSIDPHIWLSPTNAIAMTANIADVLGEIDPANAPRYRANAARQTAAIAALDQTIARQLAGNDRRFAVFHDAYRYFEHAFGLTSSAIVMRQPERQPGAAYLRALRETLEQQHVVCLFSEPQFDDRLVRALSDGLPLRYAVLDPLGAGVRAGPDAYAAILQTMADAFASCLSGDPS